MVFNDLTIEEAMALMGTSRSVDMRFGSPRYMDFTSTPLKEVQISVHGAQVINYITNPSFEFGLDGWVDQWVFDIHQAGGIDRSGTVIAPSIFAGKHILGRSSDVELRQRRHAAVSDGIHDHSGQCQ